MSTRLIATAAAAAAAILGLASAWAETTQSWKQSSYEALRRGRAENIAISGDGGLTLAPKLEEIYEAPSSYLWDLAADAEGNVFAAAGPQAKVFRIGADGRKSVLFETEGVEVHALAVDTGGNVYAATAPESRVYKIDPSGGSSLFYDPRAAYVWDMAFDAAGDLFIATGDEGKIHRVKPSGDGEVFFETGETHVRSLAFDEKGDLFAGGDPGGLILKIVPGGEPQGFVLYQSSRKEITALAAAADGTVYAAGVGSRTPTTVVRQPSQANPNAQSASPGQQSGGAPQQLQSPPPSSFVTQVRGGSAIVRIAPDGELREIWSDDAAVVYALALDGDGSVIVGTGERGRVFRIAPDGGFTLLTTLTSSQATALHRAGDGSMLVAASNIGKVYRLGPELAAEGTFESSAQDAERFAHWGRLEWSGDPGGGSIAVSARSGNLDRPPRFWSGWSAEADEATGLASALPGARYAQWRATLRRGDGEPPRLDAVTLFYRPANVAPRVTEIEVVEPNYRFPPQTRSRGGIRTLSLPPLGSPAPRRSSSAARPQTLAFSQGAQSARWNAEDDNEDALTYTVEIRGEAEAAWLPLEKNLQEAEVSFDSTAFADGLYRLRVVASDAGANPLGEGLSGERVSQPFLIDNTAPELVDLRARRDGDVLRVRFRAADSATKIVQAEVSVNAGEWRAVLPETGMLDSREASFAVELEAPEGEAVVAARVADQRENVTVAKTVVR